MCGLARRGDRLFLILSLPKGDNLKKAWAQGIHYLCYHCRHMVLLGVLIVLMAFALLFTAAFVCVCVVNACF